MAAQASVKQQFIDEFEQAFGLQADNNRPELAESLGVNLAAWAQPLRLPNRYKCLYGGRGSGKSYAIADALLIEGLKRPIRVLCAREFQVSIKESVHALLKARIEKLNLGDFYSSTREEITGENGSQFIFKGVRHNVESIKSMAGLSHLWLEEAQTVSAESWQVLIPTIREEGSEIWVSFNPLHASDTVYKELVEKKRQNAYVERVNWDKNPFFPSVLEDERRSLQAADPDAYNHIWEGGFWEKSDAQIFNGKWAIEEFEPGAEWSGPYHGADWGFASDPTTAIRCWIYDRRLYIERESYAHGLELDETSHLWLADIPSIDQYALRADSSRPDSISHVKRGRAAAGNDPGCPPIPRIVGAIKGPGSIEDGITHIRSYEKVIIHPSCKHTAEEFRLYSYKTDKISGDILPIIVDANNHLIDALRYALEPIIRAAAPARRHTPVVHRRAR